jgi:hypothetical protein
MILIAIWWVLHFWDTFVLTCSLLWFLRFHRLFSTELSYMFHTFNNVSSFSYTLKQVRVCSFFRIGVYCIIDFIIFMKLKSFYHWRNSNRCQFLPNQELSLLLINFNRLHCTQLLYRISHISLLTIFFTTFSLSYCLSFIFANTCTIFFTIL